MCLAMFTASAQPQPGMMPQGGANGRGMMKKEADSVVTKMIAEVVPQFTQLSYADEQTGKTLPYHLFVPKDYDPYKKYPMVLYMSDASTAGDDAMRPLTQGWGGLIWATEEEQQKHPAFVLVPAYTAKAVDDDWSTTDEVEMTIRLLDKLCDDYSIDRSRLYTTGQSMGGMMSFYFNIHHPHLFAASMFVGSQWDTSKMSPFIGNKFFYIVAGGDEKASKGMAELEQVLAAQGVTPAKGEWSAKLPSDEQNAKVAEMLAKGNAINFISFSKGSVLPESGRGMEHMASFDYAYKLGAVRDWLFEQRLDSMPSPTNPLVIANDGDWHGDNITPLMAIKKAIDKGAYAVVFDVYASCQTLKTSHGNTSVPTTLEDAKSLAKGRIHLLARSEKEIAFNDVVNLAVVNLDSSNWKKLLTDIINQRLEFVELRYSKSDKQLDKALKLTNGKVKVLVNTSAQGLAANHVDPERGGDSQKAWGTLADKGVSGIITNQIKPMLKWVGSK